MYIWQKITDQYPFFLQFLRFLKKKFLASYIAILYKTIIYLKANMDFANFSLLDMPY